MKKLISGILIGACFVMSGCYEKSYHYATVPLQECGKILEGQRNLPQPPPAIYIFGGYPNFLSGYDPGTAYEFNRITSQNQMLWIEYNRCLRDR
ncbi:MAG: hypothetical protein ACYDBV_00955 [Nitrospiria bacterium]